MFDPSEDIKEITNSNSNVENAKNLINFTENNNSNKKKAFSMNKNIYRNLYNAKKDDRFINTVQSIYSFNHKKNNINLPIII